ncbi:MAG: hypothetical protein JJ957_03920 [Pseudomonadales bacterium]|nr:hypothetical protein [Pseudomonadales bacterium]MBO6594966.1 hypothetical protein [Pseudomonadales bacterium]MBO6821475.1 hypothetical protein [Pseudomonadales bacterium]
MDEKLKQIDRDLIDLENALLYELQRLQLLDEDSVYSEIDPAIHREMKDYYRKLVAELEGDSKDWSNLSLKSFEQEWVEGRMKIVRNLLVRKLPTVFLTISENQNRAQGDSEFGTEEHYAAPWLAILDEVVAMHVVDGRTIEEIAKERAQFSSRDLDHEQEKLRERRAQSPDEIRNKLKGKMSGSGASQFAARELSNTISPVANAQPVKPAKKKEIAQSPDEIRRKLAERGSSAGGKASFGAKDLSSAPAPSAPAAPVKKAAPAKEIAQSPDEIRRKLAERGSSSGGKASFGAKDIQSANEKYAKKEEPKEAPSGPASFEAKDLSDPKP